MRQNPKIPEPMKLTAEALLRTAEEFRAWSNALKSRTRAMEILTPEDLGAQAR